MKTFDFDLMILMEVEQEILRGNEKHGHGDLATPIQAVAILTKELGEFAAAIMQKRADDARKELIQVVAVAMNCLHRTGPHFSNKK